MSSRQFGIITVVLALLILLSSVYRVGAAPPEPPKEPSSTPRPPVGEHTTISIGEYMTIDIEIEASPQFPATPSAAPLLPDSESASGSDNAISLLAVDGHWTGTTSRGYPMSFDVASGGTTWSNFKLKTNFSVGGCSGTVETTVFGPGPIINNQFSSSTGSFSFSGQFSTPTSVSGTYSYVNHSIPGCGNFTQSGTWTANTTAQPQIPNPPSNLTALALSQMQILLQWQDNSNNETGFKIEQALTSIGPWTQIATTPATSLAPAGLACNTTYYYRVRAYNGFGNSAYSNIANATTSPCTAQPPLAPSNLTATSVSKTQINLMWQDNSNSETGFKIERSPNSTSWVQIAAVGPNVTSYANTGLTCDSTYFYRVQAYNASGNSPYSNTANDTPPCTENDTNIYLPLILKAPPTPPPPGSKPVDWHWTGTTNRSQPMSFDVSSGGTILNNFKLKTTFSVGGCSGTTEVTVSGPGFAITNNQFSHSGGTFSFSGQFSSPTIASGTYSFVNYPGCGGFSQSGTWTANAP
ncbi:MAG: fibronectin type III domain-containing protein [Anaerolineae bacterium]|nr:fibronectin type III domain-containing protein [Anaerolineae bacterium]